MTLEDRIIDRLKRNEEMRQRIADMEQASETQSRPIATWSIPHSAIALSLAACLAIVIYVAPWATKTVEQSPLDALDIALPTLTEYRAGSATSAEIDSLMSAQQYETSLALIERALVLADEELATLKESNSDGTDETILYEEELMEAHHYQLQWMRIYVLVRLERNKEAISALTQYVTIIGDHQAEAKQLLERLTNKL